MAFFGPTKVEVCYECAQVDHYNRSPGLTDNGTKEEPVDPRYGYDVEYHAESTNQDLTWPDGKIVEVHGGVEFRKVRHVVVIRHAGGVSKTLLVLDGAGHVLGWEVRPG